MASQLPEQAARRREQHAASQVAHRARGAVQRARIVARMAAEGMVAIRVDEFRFGLHGHGTFWAPSSWEGPAGRFRFGYRRMTVTHVSTPPRWSRYHSITGASGDHALALPDATIYVRPL